MSKEGVKKTLEQRKSRKKVNLEERNGVIGKVCTGECDEWKPLESYTVANNKSLGGRSQKCKECQKKYREQNKPRAKAYGKTYYLEHKDTIKERAKEHYENNKENKLEYIKDWQQNNPETVKTYKKKWSDANKDKKVIKESRRRARKRNLPDTLTSDEYEITLAYFGNSCALTGESLNIEKDHALPIAIGYGGTIFGNCYPLSCHLNQSKGDSNIFEWFEANRQRFDLSQERFDKLIAWLASANAMTVEEYRDYVYWCHANPRSIDELEAK